LTNKVNILTGEKMNTLSVNLAVATKIKNYRQQHKLSLDALAQRAGISKGMLVEIEKNTANPSIAILCKLATALGMSVADLVSVQDAPAIRLVSKDEMPILWQGEQGGRATLLAGTSGAQMVELWRWELVPGECFHSPAHSQGTVEILYMHKGSLRFVVGESELLLKAGQAAVATTDQVHCYENIGTTKAEFTLSVVEIPRG
jgi:transcriptional regulator with XRE-family HTH domain